MARTGGVHAETTDPRYRKMAEAALGYARAEFEDEVKKLRKENAELKAAAAKALRAPAAGGHGPAPAEDDGTRSPLALALTRARALALFLVFLSVTTVILEGYEHTLAQHVSLAFFVPFLIGHGGNAGGMSVGAIISAIAKGRVPTRSHAYRVATRELVCGLGVAVQLAALTAVARALQGDAPSGPPILLSIQAMLNCGKHTAGDCLRGSISGVYKWIIDRGDDGIPYETCQGYEAVADKAGTAETRCKMCVLKGDAADDDADDATTRDAAAARPPAAAAAPRASRPRR